MNLLECSKNITSQYGEDGIIEFIFSKIEPTSKYCVEFGAWDGRHLSNTWNLIHNRKWGGCLIEGSKKRYQDLLNATKDNDKISAVNAFVSEVGNSSLDALLDSVNAPKDIDLISIDIDGNDYGVWNGLKKYQQKVVVIEYNSTFPPHSDFVDIDGKCFCGSSAKAMMRLGKEKGYELICCTVSNCFFVKNEYFSFFEISDNSAESLQHKEDLCYVAKNYAGEYIFSNKNTSHIPLKAIVYSSWKKWIKHFILDKKSFFYFGDSYK